jgi:subtilase family serine protease
MNGAVYSRTGRHWRLLAILAFEVTASPGQQQILSPQQEHPVASESQSPTDTSTHQRVWYRDRWLNFVVVNGLAIAEGDIVLGSADDLSRSPKQTGQREASVVAGDRFRWPGGVIPYAIDESGSQNPDLSITTREAMKHWEESTSVRFVSREREADYVVFSAREIGCYARGLGRIGGAQTINLGRGCGYAAAVHEIGHAAGLWHEQSRNDRDSFVQAEIGNVEENYRPQFEKSGPAGSDIGYYDFGSIMHYPELAFSRNRQPTLITIPPRIPIGQRERLSPGDIDAVERMYGSTQRPFTVTSVPAGLEVIVDGSACLTPCLSSKWEAGSRHTVSARTPQFRRADPLEYHFARWNDDGASEHEVLADPTKAVLTANFAPPEPGDGPDLVVTRLSAPTDATAGETLPGVDCEVRNIGNADAGPFRLGFYVSADPLIRNTDRFLGWSCRFDKGLASGVISGCRGDISLPKDLPTGMYYLGAIADDLSEVTETNEANNGLENQNGPTSVRSLVPALPDLTVTSFSASTTVVSGQRLAGMRVDVRNQGLGGAGRFRIGFYLSADPVGSARGWYTGWSCSRSFGLAAGDSFACAGDIGLPASVASGRYYLIVVVDDLGEVAETDESNNARDSDTGPIEVLPAPRPDLTVISVSTPAVGTIGRNLPDVYARVKNQGNASAGPFRIGFYFSTNSIISTSDVRARFVCNIRSGLAPGEIVICAGDVDIPASLRPGPIHFGVMVDDLREVQESDEDNNTRLCDGSPIMLVEILKPDLVISSFYAPTSGTSGGILSGIRVEVRNQGTAASGRFRVGAYLSTDITISTADVFTGWTCTVSAGLPPGTSLQCGGDIRVASTIAPGRYYLGIIADDLREVEESNEDNNTRLSDSGPVSVSAPPAPDLVVTAFFAPNTGTVGGRLTGTVVYVKNQGTAPAGPFRVGFYLWSPLWSSTESVWTGPACFQTGRVDPGQTFSCSAEISIAATTAPGIYYLFAAADDLRQVVESDERNNSLWNGRGPTLITR